MSSYLVKTARAGYRAPHTLDGLGEAQSYYDRIDADQKALTVRLAEIAAADSGAWDAVWNALQASGGLIPGTNTWFYGWGYAKQAILDQWNKLVVTVNSGPSGQDFIDAERLLADTGAMVSYYKKTVPEQASKIAIESADMRDKMNAISPLQSPEKVGWDTFQKELAARADSMMKVGMPILLIAVVLGGGLVLYSFMNRRRIT